MPQAWSPVPGTCKMSSRKNCSSPQSKRAIILCKWGPLLFQNKSWKIVIVDNSKYGYSCTCLYYRRNVEDKVGDRRTSVSEHRENLTSLWMAQNHSAVCTGAVTC